jgi:hypothetical protein
MKKTKRQKRSRRWSKTAKAREARGGLTLDEWYHKEAIRMHQESALALGMLLDVCDEVDECNS